MLDAGATGAARTRCLGFVSPYAAQGRFHGRPGRDAVVDDDRDAPCDRDRLNLAQIKAPAALDFGQRALLSCLEIPGRRLRQLQDLIVHDELRMRAVDHRAERQFLMPGRADLAHQKKIELRVERRRHLVTDRHAAARQGQNEGSSPRKRPSARPSRRPASCLSLNINPAFMPSDSGGTVARHGRPPGRARRASRRVAEQRGVRRRSN